MAIISAVRDMDRARKIGQVLARHGFGQLAGRLGFKQKDGAGGRVPRPQLGERLRLVLQDLGPTFVKLGQMASTRGDLLPEDIVVELRKLQDDVPPFGEAEARAAVERSLGAPVEEVFASFDPKPLACASIAQVHRATLVPEEGAEPVPVAVKIQRPGIAETVQRDLNLLHFLTRTVEATFPETRIYAPTGLAREFDEAITAELDFTIEAHNATRFAKNFAGWREVHFPKVFEVASSREVLTLEFLDGEKITRAAELGADGRWIAETSVAILIKMVFEDGFFHADPHPGNVLILPRPGPEGYTPDQEITIGMLDLGLVGRLSPHLRDRTVDLLLAAARSDADGMADAMLAIGRSRGRVDRDAFRAHVRRVSERHLGKPLSEIEAAAVVQDIITGAMKFDIEVPTELTMLARAVMTLEGVGKQIYPELDFLQAAAPHLTRILWQRYSPARLSRELLHRAGSLSAMARDLPDQVGEIVEDLRRGQLEVRASDRLGARALDRLGRRLRATVVSAALIGGGTAALISGAPPALGWGAIAAAALLLLGNAVTDWRSRLGD